MVPFGRLNEEVESRWSGRSVLVGLWGVVFRVGVFGGGCSGSWSSGGGVVVEACGVGAADDCDQWSAARRPDKYEGEC